MTNERLQRIKGLPLEDLSITAVASIVDVYEDEESGKQLPVVEMEVLNEADWEKFNAPKAEACRCAMCGHSLKISCAVTHTTTGNGYWIGRDCAAKITQLVKFGPIIKGATVALAQRIACNKREADFITEHPDALGVITWSKRPAAPRICRDICEKLRRYGSISDKQIALLEKIRQQDIERRAKATGTATGGRQIIKGTVLKVTSCESEYGGSRWSKPPTITSVIIDLGNGVRLRGNCPQRITLDEKLLARLPDYAKGQYKAGCDWETHEIIQKGDKIELKATVTPSQKDNLFGFWSRPANFKITELAPPPPPAPAPAPVVDEPTLFREAVILEPKFMEAIVASPTDMMKEMLSYDFAHRHHFTPEQARRFVTAIINKNL